MFVRSDQSFAGIFAGRHAYRASSAAAKSSPIILFSVIGIEGVFNGINT
jgi:hypothetical protein